jgi:putative transposase
MSKKQNSTTYIRCSKISTKFANNSKQDALSLFLCAYSKLVSDFVDILWEMKDSNLPKNLGSDITSIPETRLSARIRQCAAKQAKGIVVGTRKKISQQQFIIKKLISAGEINRAKILQKKVDDSTVSKPNIKNLPAELDDRFIKVDLKSNNSFDGWVTISSIGNKISIKIPFKKTKHFNKLSESGVMKKGIRLCATRMDFNFEFETPLKKSGDVVGVDIGKENIFTLSNGTQIVKDNHNHTFSSIIEKLARKKRGSNAFRKAAAHRDNFANWALNQINWSSIIGLRKENIKNIYRGKKMPSSLLRWNYRSVLDKVEQRCQKEGVLSIDVNPAYTSQRCSKCGWVQKANRASQSKFCCKKCAYSANADFNAAVNISLPLSAVSHNVKLNRLNLKGFYWDQVCLDQERIVSDNLESNTIEIHKL